MLLERVAAGAGQFDRLADGDATVLAGELDDLEREFRQRGQHQFFTRNLRFQPSYLLGQRSQEKLEPWLPVRSIGADGCLGLAQRHEWRN